MKKVVGLILIAMLILTACGSKETLKTEEELKAEVKAEIEAEEKLKEELNAEIEKEGKYESKPKKKMTGSVTDDDTMFDFISESYPDFSRADYEKWTKTYMDITGDGEDEIIYSSDYGDGELDFAIVTTSEGDELREISRYIPLAKYGNTFEMKDGFFVHTAKSGGSGMQMKTMYLYYYGGHDLEPCSQDILISENVSDPDVNYTIKSEIEGTLDDFVVTYTKKDFINETKEVISKDQYIFDPGSYCIWHTPLSIKNTAKSFDSIYDEDNFIEALEYYNENLYYFGESERKAFSKRIIDVIQNDKEKFLNPHNGFLGGYEALYDSKTQKFDITGLDDRNKEIINKIQERGIYEGVKVFYTTEGAVDDCGFGVMINGWAFGIIKTAYNDTVERFNPNAFSDLEPFYVPQIYFDKWTPVKAVTRTHIVYPNVCVNSLSAIDRLKGQDTWKTDLIMPIELGNPDETDVNDTETEFTNKANFPDSEIVNSEEINYGDYFTVIIPEYSGIYYPKEQTPLEIREYSILSDGKTTLSFAVFGELNLGGFTVIKNMEDEGTFHYIGETIKDSIIHINCDLPTDASYIKVTCSVFINGENQTVEFTMDDMSNKEEYTILKYK